jgi:hypothetical protein
MDRTYSMYFEKRNIVYIYTVYRESFSRKVIRKKPLEIPRHRWEDDIKIDLIEMGWGVKDSIHLAKDDPYYEILVFFKLF